MSDAYEQWLVPTVFRPFAGDLAQRAAGRKPQRVLELAAGTGVLTRELRRVAPDADIVATDLNDAMVQVGRHQVPTATWRQADAMRLPFDDAEFDLIACQFGVMFLPDKPVAFAEARRLLQPGGTFMFNTWSVLESHTFERALVETLARLFPQDPPDFMTSVVHSYADADVVAADVRAAGFDEVSVETVTVEGHAASVAGLATGYCTGTPLRMALEMRGDLTTLTDAVVAQMQLLLGAGPVTGEMAALVVSAPR
jgi:ubiquinone/menaquinone biosynthesis C-methylase UbiE